MKRYVLAFGLFAAVVAWAGELYKWQDENGVTRYSDRMPPPAVKDFSKIRGGARTAPPAEIENVAFPLPRESRAALEKHPLTLYSFGDCGEVCKKAEAFLDRRGVPYVLKNTDQDKRELRKLTGKLEAPALVVGNTAPVVGFEEGRWGRELDMAGYAKRNPHLKAGASTALKPIPKPVPEAVAEASAEGDGESSAGTNASPAEAAAGTPAAEPAAP
jgi:glutaredoxin